LTEVRILIIGGASLDRLEGADDLVAGGAGMYTAMASYRSGASVTLYAPRPDPIPDALQLVANSLEWLGPSVMLQDFAHFEITYKDSQAVYVQSHFGGEEALSPKAMPADLSGFDCVHLIPLGNLRQQHSFMLPVEREVHDWFLQEPLFILLMNSRTTQSTFCKGPTCSS